jgi:hypothetical protein
MAIGKAVPPGAIDVHNEGLKYGRECTGSEHAAAQRQSAKISHAIFK